jgi:hypothetical protein
MWCLYLRFPRQNPVFSVVVIAVVVVMWTVYDATYLFVKYGIFNYVS